jgi:anti-anti-sigma regulatory factor
MTTTGCRLYAGEETLDAYHLVRFEGMLDASRYPEFHGAFLRVPQGVPVLVDLTLVDSVDSTFLSEMLLLKRRHDARLVTLIPPRGHVTRMFAITELGEKLHVYTDLTPAIAALGVVPAAEGAGEGVGAE